MKQLMKRIGAEWEKALFWATMAVSTTFLLVWLSAGERDNLMFSKKSAPSRSSLLSSAALRFQEGVPASELEGDNPFSFTFRRAKKRRPWTVALPTKESSSKPAAPRKRWRLPTGKKTVGRKEQETKVAKRTPTPTPKKTPTRTPTPTPKKTPVTVAKATTTPTPTPKKAPVKTPEKKVATTKAPEKKAAPAKPPEERVVTFRGIMRTATGKQVAWVQVYDPAAKEEEPRTRYLTVGRKIEGIEIRSVSESSLSVIDPQGQERTIAFRQSEKITIE